MTRELVGGFLDELFFRVCPGMVWIIGKLKFADLRAEDGNRDFD